jgi:hypothetical protein
MNGFRDVAWGVAALLIVSVAPAQAAVAPRSAPAQPDRSCRHAAHHRSSHSCHRSAGSRSSDSGGAPAPTMPGIQNPTAPGPVTPPSTGHFPQPHPTPGNAAPSGGNQKHRAP